MDGQVGWLTLRYSFSWVRINKTHLSVLEAQSELRWPTMFNVAFENVHMKGLPG